MKDKETILVNTLCLGIVLFLVAVIVAVISSGIGYTFGYEQAMIEMGL